MTPERLFKEAMSPHLWFYHWSCGAGSCADCDWRTKSYPLQRAQRALAGITQDVLRLPCEELQSLFWFCFWRRQMYIHKCSVHKWRPWKGPTTSRNKAKECLEGQYYDNSEDLESGTFPPHIQDTRNPERGRKEGKMSLGYISQVGRWAGMVAPFQLLPLIRTKVRKGLKSQPKSQTQGKSRTLRERRTQLEMLSSWFLISTILYYILHLLPKTNAHLSKISGLIKDNSNGQNGIHPPYGFNWGKTTPEVTAMLGSSWLARILLTGINTTG